MPRPEKSLEERKKPRTISMTDNEWAYLKYIARKAKKDISEYIIDKLKIKNEPVKKDTDIKS